MSRMQSDRSNSVRITVRVDEDLKDRYKSSVDSMSDDLREHIRDAAGRATEGANVPEDDRLARAYRLLERNSTFDNRIDVDVAENLLAQELGMNKAVVRTSVTRKLETLGYLAPKWGTFAVKPLDE
ncbi:hypothetical protein C2R22_10720 [Salinigranum rubrum]|uniref:Uncharacterized protein n=1 Tax=Salinigranum rubrum TaxID=755307 RepID=A0A2I8VJF5_9EURY|nr:hypothetical protein [Salinigranum rubrum]AUV82062.1 hypothetical protein C2R22_10720 [Salinigranum rubrum]